MRYFISLLAVALTLSACMPPTPPTVSGTNRVPVNKSTLILQDEQQTKGENNVW